MFEENEVLSVLNKGPGSFVDHWNVGAKKSIPAMSSITDTRTHQMLGKQGKRKAENPLLNDASKRTKKAVSSYKFLVQARDIYLRQKVSSFRPQILFPNGGSNSRPIATIDDSEVEHDVRVMEDETDHLRRNSRAHTTSLHSTNSALQFDSNATPKLKRNKELRKSSNGLRKSSSGRGKRISSSFEATGVLCEFMFNLTKVVLKYLFVNRSTSQLCIR